MLNGAAAMENSTEVPPKIKIELSQDPAIPLLGIHPPQNEIKISKRYLHSHVHYSIIHNSQDLETTEVFLDGYMDIEIVVDINNGILFKLKKKRNSCHM